MKNFPVRIVAMGKYLPAKVDSSDLEKAYSIPQGWSLKRSGVESRHHVTFESGGYMGARAIEEALTNANLALKDIDLILSAGATFDYSLPSQSSIIKSELKEGLSTHMPTIDIDSTCLSFVNACEVAASLLAGKTYKRIVIVSSEISSKGLDYTNWETCTLFGDCAVAAILEWNENGDSTFIKSGTRSYSEGVKHTIIEGGGNAIPYRTQAYDNKLHTFQMQGIKLLKLSKKKIPDFISWFFEDIDMSLSDVDRIIPHQASKTGLAIFQKMYNLKEGQMLGNLQTHGNCIAASIPSVLCENIFNNNIKRGDTVFLTGTSAGFAIGGILIRY